MAMPRAPACRDHLAHVRETTERALAEIDARKAAWLPPHRGRMARRKG